MLVQYKQNKKQMKIKPKTQRSQKLVLPKQKSRKSAPNDPSNSSVLEYMKSVNDPFTFRGVRCPSLFPAPTQVKTISGLITFTTNAAGYARVIAQAATGSINLYNDSTHSETTLGPQTTLVNNDTDIANSTLMRLVSGGMRLRSLQSFNSESGQVHSYMTLLGPNASYDVYRDSPYQKIYSKGEVSSVRFLPVDNSLTELNRTSNLISFPIYGWNIGFMISGAVSSTYSLQYTLNYEYSSSNNTDLVPHQRGPVGDIRDIIGQIHNNGANPADHNHDFLSKVSGIGKIFQTLNNGFRAVSNFSSGGAMSLLGGGLKFL